MGHILEKDEVMLWKTANISLPNDRFMMVLYYYHSDRENRANSFYKCNIRIDSRENWMKLRESLLNESPASPFRTSMLGLDDDYKMHYAHHQFNKADMYRWINTKFSPVKICDMDTFEREELGSGKKEPFMRKYVVNGVVRDITDVGNIPEGHWFSTFRPKETKRKKYGNIVM